MKEKEARKIIVQHRFIQLMDSNLMKRPFFIIQRGRYILEGGTNIHWDDIAKLEIDDIKKWYALAVYQDCGYAGIAMDKFLEEERHWKKTENSRAKSFRLSTEGAGEYAEQNECDRCEHFILCSLPIEVTHVVPSMFFE